MSKRLAMITLLAMMATALHAQSGFRYSGAIGIVDTDGFYNIALRPDLVAKSKADLGDLRIVDLTGKFVRYVLSAADTFVPKSVYTRLPKVNASQTDSTSVFENTTHLPLNAVWLTLRNTVVNRNISVSGSDDLKQWFAVKEDIPLQPAGDAGNSSYQQRIILPPSNYRYLKITVNERHKNPVAIMEAGVFYDKMSNGGFVEIPAPAITKKDSGRSTWIMLKFANAFQIDKLLPVITAPHYFKRRVNVFLPETKGLSLLTQFTISPGTTQIPVSAKTNLLILEIENEDNPPLTLPEVKAAMRQKDILAYLEKGKFYTLITGNDTARSPVYDLKFFADSLKGTHRLLDYGPVKAIVAHKTVIKDGNKNPWLLWGTIAAALMVLTFLTVKMTSEINKRQNEGK